MLRKHRSFWFYTTIKAPGPSLTKVRIIYPLWHSRIVRNSILTFGGYLAGTTPMLSARSSLFCCAGAISSVQVSCGSLVTFSASLVGAVCRKGFVIHSKRFLDKELHGTYSINGDHQQRSGRRAATICSRETSADSKIGRAHV